MNSWKDVHVDDRMDSLFLLFPGSIPTIQNFPQFVLITLSLPLGSWKDILLSSLSGRTQSFSWFQVVSLAPRSFFPAGTAPAKTHCQLYSSFLKFVRQPAPCSLLFPTVNSSKGPFGYQSHPCSSALKISEL